ncbi:MAG: ribosome maturation factor RimP [Clostridia bacterium]|nr:ribosome maturation factor RimP [Clostridia bacterium]
MKGNAKNKKVQMEKLRDVCSALAEEKGLTLYDVNIDLEGGARYLRVYIDRPGGIDLNACENYHRALIPLVDDYPYDYLEVSSPGIDRVLKFESDILAHIGSRVEVRLYEPLLGGRTHQGSLREMADEVVIARGDELLRFPAAKVAQVRLVPDLNALEDEGADAVELYDDDNEGGLN